MSGRGLTRARRAGGFSLIELVVVLAIIALLAAILLPALGRARLAAQNQVGLNNHRQLAVGIFAYAAVNDGYSPTDTPNRYADYPDEPLAERAGGWLIWSQDENNPRDGGEQGEPQHRYLGLGKLLYDDLVVLDCFFHPVMSEPEITGKGLSGHHWAYRHNVGREPGDPGYTPSSDPPGPYAGFVGSHMAYRNGDRTAYWGDYPSTEPDLDLKHNLVGGPGFSESTLLFDTPWENRGNRMGGTMAYTLGDGSTHTHQIPFFFGSEPRSSWSNAGIDAVNPAAGYLWPATPTCWSSNTDLADGGPAVGWWAYLIDRHRRQ